ASFDSSGVAGDSEDGGANCTDAHGRFRPGAQTRLSRTHEIHAAESGAWPDRSSLHGPHRPAPATRYRRACSAAESDDDGCFSFALARWPHSAPLTGSIAPD